MEKSYKIVLNRFFSNYGMLGILIILGILFSILTLRDQYPVGEDAAKALSNALFSYSHDTGILIISRDTDDDTVFAVSLEKRLSEEGFDFIERVSGDPITVRKQISDLPDVNSISIIATSFASAPVAYSIKNKMPGFADAIVASPPPYRWPTFLLPDNLRNVANQIAVIAIIAIGMTLVIITAGIDLSVGSLIALSAVVTTWFVGRVGGESATFWGMLLSGILGIALCGVIGAFSGLMITRFRIPPFIATLAMMQVAAGFAYVISEGKPIYHLPDSFHSFGARRGAVTQNSLCCPAYDCPIYCCSYPHDTHHDREICLRSRRKYGSLATCRDQSTSDIVFCISPLRFVSRVRRRSDGIAIKKRRAHIRINLRALCYSRRCGRRYEPFRGRGTNIRNPDWRVYYRCHSKRDEPDQCRNLYAENRFRTGDIGGGAFR